MPAYNALLYAWSALTLAAIAMHSGDRRWALLGFLITLPAKREALHRYAWVQEQARVRPAWWNRSGLRRPGLDMESEEWRVADRMLNSG